MDKAIERIVEQAEIEKLKVIVLENIFSIVRTYLSLEREYVRTVPDLEIFDHEMHLASRDLFRQILDTVAVLGKLLNVDNLDWLHKEYMSNVRHHARVLMKLSDTALYLNEWNGSRSGEPYADGPWNHFWEAVAKVAEEPVRYGTLHKMRMKPRGFLERRFYEWRELLKRSRAEGDRLPPPADF